MNTIASSKKSTISRRSLACAFAVTLALGPAAGNADPEDLPQRPLFLSAGVEPNVLLTLDNSTSMLWETTMRSDRVSGLVIDENGRGRDPDKSRRQGVTIGDLYSNNSSRNDRFFPPADGTNPDWDRYWVARNSIANPMYYDPARTYLPWPGKNADGSDMFANADPTNVRDNPLSGDRYDLTETHTYSADGDSTEVWIPTYFTWTDTDGDGIVDVSDQHTAVRIRPNTPEMQNFANWYLYHRRRFDAAKYVAGNAVSNAGRVRMGINLFNDNIFVAVESMQDPAKKVDLLRQLYASDMGSGGTPARASLARAGEYFRQTGSSAPILPEAQGGACQQNFNVLLADGAWNGDDPSNIGNRDQNLGSSDTIFDGNAAESNDGGNYSDQHSDTLADVAMKYYESDLRTDIRDLVPTQEGRDYAEHQHLVNYVVSFSVLGHLDPLVDDPLDALFPGWPDPLSSDNGYNALARADDMWHAAYNSRGRYFSAQGSAALTRSFEEIANDISSRTATSTSVGVNANEINTDTYVYAAEFESGDWTGDLMAFQIADEQSGRLASAPSWRAGELLTARSPASRQILTYNPSLGESVPFQWQDIPVPMRVDLNINEDGQDDGNGESRLNFIRGDRSNEGTGLGFRERKSLLGNIVNSAPIYVGAPALNWPDIAPFPTGTDAYSAFKNANSDRKPAVYVGANDGMLHGFRADDANASSVGNGEEFFAYVPNILASSVSGEGLHHHSRSAYNHQFQVDLTPTISDAFVSLGGSGAQKWRTVLIGGLRGGGRGLFALDISSQADLTEDRADRVALWEFSAADDADLGHSYSKPVIALTNAGVWVAIFGNGYNDIGDGKPHLFIVNLDKGGDGTWIEGDDYLKLSAVGGSTTNRNGLASPAVVDTDGNGTVDRVYAGDLHGQMWAFDLSSDSPSLWGLANGITPLFATPGTTNEPITSKPIVTRHPTLPSSSTNLPNLMVYFGTGRFLTEGDIDDTHTQKFYGVWDRGDDLRETDLKEQFFDSSFASGNVLGNSGVDYSVYDGWYFELPDTGERVITSALARGATLFFNSYVPSADLCASDGYGYSYAVDLATGGSRPTPPFDVNRDAVVDADDLVVNDSGSYRGASRVRQDGILPDPVIVEDILYTGTEPTVIESLDDLPTGRISWQEIAQ